MGKSSRAIDYILFAGIFAAICGFSAGNAAAQPAPAAPPNAPAPAAPAPGPAAAAPAPAAPAPAPAAPAPAPAPEADANAPLVPNIPGGEASPITPALPPATPEQKEEFLGPKGEIDLMAPHPVAVGDIKFKPVEGLSVKSSDKLFSLAISPRFQFLYTLLDKSSGPNEVTQSFQIRRARIVFAGNGFGEHNKYKVELAFSPTDMNSTATGPTTTPLLEAYSEFDYLRDLTVRAGQYKVPYDRIRLTSDVARELVDFSNVTNEFQQERDLGVVIRSSDFLGMKMFKYDAGIFSGKGRNSFALGNTGMLYVVRGDFLPLGLFDDYSEADFERTGPRLAIGAAYEHLENALKDRGTLGNVPADKGTTDLNMFVVDGAFKFKGFSALGSFYYRHGNRDSGPLTDSTGAPILDDGGKPITTSPTRDGIGIVAQAGYLLPYTPFQVAFRYATARGRDKPLHDGLSDATELGGGLGYYPAQHNLKLQADYFRLYGDDGFSKGSNQFRLQLQFVL